MDRKIAIIPARGGSKRFPRKNIADFYGRPLIAYTIETLQNSGLFDKIHVSTDDQEVADTAAEFGCPVDFMRAADIADDVTPLIPVIRWVLQEYAARNQDFDEVCLMMPCAPLIEPDDLKRAYKIFSEGNTGLPVISATEFPVPIEWAYAIDGDGTLDPREPGMFAVQSQDLGKHYYDSGAFCFIHANQVLQEKFSGGGKMLPYILPRHRAVDIDEPEDLKFARILFRGLQGSNE